MNAEFSDDGGVCIEKRDLKKKPTVVIPQQAHRLLSGKNQNRGYCHTGQANHPNRLRGAHPRHDLGSQQPEKEAESYSRKNRPTDSGSAAVHCLGIPGVWRLLSPCHDNRSQQHTENSRRPHAGQWLAAQPRQQESQRWITGGERRDHRHFSDFKCPIERQRRKRVDASREQTPRPRSPAGSVREMSPSSEPRQKNREQDKSDALHVKHGAKRADAAGCKSREKIGAAPGERRQEAQQNSHYGLRGLALFDFEAEDGHHFLEIFPDFTLRGRITKQIRRMIRRQQFSSAEFQPLSAKLRNATVGLQQRFRRDGAEADNYFRSDGVDLPQ